MSKIRVDRGLGMGEVLAIVKLPAAKENIALKNRNKTGNKGNDSASSQSFCMGRREWTLLVLLSILWGGSFFFNGYAVLELPPLIIVFCRVSLAALVLLGVVHARGGRMPASPRLWGAFIVMGALNNVLPFSLIVWGQTHIGSGLASILNATTPIFTVLLARSIMKERLTGNRITGVLLGWVGVLILIGVESLRGWSTEASGEVAVLGAALSYAFAAIYGRRFKGVDSMVVAAGMLCASSVMMLPVALFEWGNVTQLSWQTVLAVLGLAVLSTSLAYVIYFKLLASAGPTNLLLVTFLIPVSAIFLGALVLHEQLGWNHLVGMGFIFGGLLAIDGRVPARLGFRRG